MVVVLPCLQVKAYLCSTNFFKPINYEETIIDFRGNQGVGSPDHFLT
jgi:hypothetical protein